MSQSIKRHICASISCAEYFRMEDTLRICETETVDYLHIDLMDGMFVENYGFSIRFVHELRKRTSLPFDFHLMVNEPLRVFSWLDLRDGNIVTVHYESTKHLDETLQELRKYPVQCFLALNTETDISSAEPYLSLINGICILLVKPGFIGQPMENGSLEKVQALRHMLDKNGLNISIQADGNVTFEHAETLKNLGVSHFVCGSSSIFDGTTQELSERIRRFRQALR